jgi:glycosyltransferase involved in cell wall biosynthesis
VLYAASDVFIQASLREACGIAALEARSAGLPVILRSGIGATEFLEEGIEGLFAPTDDGLADAMVRLALDGPLRQRMASHNRATDPGVSWQRVRARVEALYAETEHRS